MRGHLIDADATSVTSCLVSDRNRPDPNPRENLPIVLQSGSGALLQETTRDIKTSVIRGVVASPLIPSTHNLFLSAPNPDSPNPGSRPLPGHRSAGSSNGAVRKKDLASSNSRTDQVTRYYMNFWADPPVARGTKARPHQRQLKATGCAVSSKIGVTDPLPPFVVIKISEISVMPTLYKSGRWSHNI